jgi:hypothetical protein
MLYTVVRRRLIATGPESLPAIRRLASSWKLRTLVFECGSIAQARLRAADERQYSNEDQYVRATNRYGFERFGGHQCTPSPGGVGLL